MVKSGSDTMQNEGKMINGYVAGWNKGLQIYDIIFIILYFIYLTGLSIASKGILELYVADSNEALQFRLIRDESELKRALSEDNSEDGKSFAPEMSHQIYGDK